MMRGWWRIWACGVLLVACQARAAAPLFNGSAADMRAKLARLPPLPPGFSLDLYHPAPVPSARALAISAASAGGSGPIITYVGSNDEGKVWALVDDNRNGTADRAVVLLSDLDSPAGVAWVNGSLLVAHWLNGTLSRQGELEGGYPVIVRLPGVDAYALAGKPYDRDPEVVLQSQLAPDRSHAQHYIRVAPDGRTLIVPQGAPCNICTPPGGTANASVISTSHAAIHAFDLGGPPGANLTPIATGVRNSVGFDWHPDSDTMYFTDNGRDRIGDDRPDCELNVISSGSVGSPPFYGYPFCQSEGRGSPYLRDAGATYLCDPNVNADCTVMNCSDPSTFNVALQALGPHTAPLGMRFYRRDAAAGSNNTGNGSDPFPPEYDRAALVALRGSWDRELLNGYALVAMQLGADGRPSNYSKLVNFVVNENTTANEFLGRPVDLQQLPDGSLLVSDDTNGAVFRLTYNSSAASKASSGAGAARRGSVLGAVPALATVVLAALLL